LMAAISLNGFEAGRDYFHHFMLATAHQLGE